MGPGGRLCPACLCPAGSVWRRHPAHRNPQTHRPCAGQHPQPARSLRPTGTAGRQQAPTGGPGGAERGTAGCCGTGLPVSAPGQPRRNTCAPCHTRGPGTQHQRQRTTASRQRRTPVPAARTCPHCVGQRRHRSGQRTSIRPANGQHACCRTTRSGAVAAYLPHGRAHSRRFGRPRHKPQEPVPAALRSNLPPSPHLPRENPTAKQSPARKPLPAHPRRPHRRPLRHRPQRPARPSRRSGVSRATTSTWDSLPKKPMHARPRPSCSTQGCLPSAKAWTHPRANASACAWAPTPAQRRPRRRRAASRRCTWMLWFFGKAPPRTAEVSRRHSYLYGYKKSQSTATMGRKHTVHLGHPPHLA
jgi:hypothetical protein